jgi:hypothetical protein
LVDGINWLFIAEAIFSTVVSLFGNRFMHIRKCPPQFVAWQPFDSKLVSDLCPLQFVAWQPFNSKLVSDLCQLQFVAWQPFDSKLVSDLYPP